VQRNGEIAVELPPGTVLDWIPRARSCDFLHVSRDGRYVVFRDGAGRRIVLADRERKVARALVEPLAADSWGLAWGPTGREVWFTEGAGFGARHVYAVDLEGRRRLVYRSTGTLGLVDSAPDGRMLFHRSLDRYGAMALLPGSRMERDVTVNDNSFIGALSADGRLLLLNSVSEGTGFSVYLRRDGGDPVRIAAGKGVDISPDGRSTLVVDNEELSVVPIGPGLPRKVNLGTFRAEGGTWVPSPHGGLIVRGRERPDEPYRFWLIDEAGSRTRKLDAGAFGSRAISPDGETLAARTALDTISIIPLAGGPARAIRVGDPDLGVGRWSADGRSLFLGRRGSWPCEIHRLDLATGKTELWKQASPPDATGMVWCAGILPSADGESYVYVANRSLASLIVAEGLR
jgi:Tol biopolymer transport system component